MAEEGYSGYENWETWNVSLWLSNDEGLYNQSIQIMLDNPPRYSKPAKAYFADEASEALEEFVEELLDNNTITDKISIHRVDWQEVLMDKNKFAVTEEDEDRIIWNDWFKQVEKNPDGNYALRRY